MIFKALQGLIKSDLSLGEQLGVNGTPAFFLDGESMENVSPADLTKLLKDQEKLIHLGHAVALPFLINLLALLEML